MWKDSVDFRDSILSALSTDQVDNLKKIYGIHYFLHGCLPVKEYVPSDRYCSLSISEYGQSCLDAVDAKKEHSKAVRAIACLIVLCHQDFLIDLEHSDIINITDALSDDIKSKRLFLPDRFGRSLYDKFNDRADGSRIDHLEPENVDDLTKDQAQGVYQVGQLISGPLGIIEAEQFRFVPPSIRIPLWHCSDTGCQHRHSVEMLRHDTAIFDLADAVLECLHSTVGKASEWEQPVEMLYRQGLKSRGKRYYDILPLICDTIVTSDREILVKTALQTSSARSIRSIIGKHDQLLANAKPDLIIKGIDQQTQLQLLMTFKDDELVRLVDKCILTDLIKIPLAERRAAKSSVPTLSSYDEPSLISTLGIRVEQDHPALYLSTLIWRAYEDKQQLSELAWRTQKGNNISQVEIPLEYMKTHDPRSVVQKLILSSGSITSWIAEKINVDLALCSSEDQVIDVILWRCGFNPPRFDTKYLRIKMQLDQFRTELLRYRGRLTEIDRDSIRSKGVNVFVSLENLIEEIICYNTWILSSDHFLATNSRFDQSYALNRVADVIGAEIGEGDYRVSWRRQGGNVLGTLLLYARATARWMEQLGSRTKEDVLRPSADLPHFVSDEVHKFPFYHTELWADSDPIRLREYTLAFSELVAQFEMSKLAEVRNGLDHYREEDRFPSLETMVFCQAKLSDALEFADVNRFVPKMFWLNSYTIDAFGRSDSELTDYRGQKIQIRGPEPIVGTSSISFSVPFLVPFGNLIGFPNSEIIFKIRNNTAFSRFWAGYPRRLNVNAPTEAQVEIPK